MLRISYHGTHSSDYCDHASDPLEVILAAYVEAGFTHVGVTEHLPPESDAFRYEDEVEQGHTAVFLKQRLSGLFGRRREALQQEFGKFLQLRIGFETEWTGEDPAGRIRQAIFGYQPEIVVASVHHVDNIPIDYTKELYQQAIDKAGDLQALWSRYYDQQLELIELFSRYTAQFPVVLGHMDLIKLLGPKGEGPSQRVWEKIVRNIEAAVAGGLVFDVNARAFKKELEEPYPGPAILEEIAKQGGLITFGDDSHAAAEVGLYYEQAQPIAARYFKTAVAFEADGDGYRCVELPLSA